MNVTDAGVSAMVSAELSRKVKLYANYMNEGGERLD
jgi:hypothetical protein